MIDENIRVIKRNNIHFFRFVKIMLLTQYNKTYNLLMKLKDMHETITNKSLIWIILNLVFLNKILISNFMNEKKNLKRNDQSNSLKKN